MKIYRLFLLLLLCIPLFSCGDDDDDEEVLEDVLIESVELELEFDDRTIFPGGYEWFVYKADFTQPTDATYRKAYMGGKQIYSTGMTTEEKGDIWYGVFPTYIQVISLNKELPEESMKIKIDFYKSPYNRSPDKY